MIDNKIRYEVDGSGGYIALPVGSVRALTDYTSIIELVSPLPLDTSVMVNFLVYDARNVDLPLFMAPNGKKGWQVSNNPLVAEWNVWEVGIDQPALTAIAKYRAGRIGVSFTFRERRPSKNAITYKGVFDEFNALPTTGMSDGDYYVCKSYNLILAGVKYTYNDNAVWQSAKWVRDRNMRTIATTSTTELPVDPALLANIPEVPEQDIADLIAQWGGGFIDMQTHINNEEIHVSPADRENWYAMLPKDGSEPMEGNLNMDGNEITGVDNIQFNRGTTVGGLMDNDFTINLGSGETFTFSENGLNMYLNKLTGVVKGVNPKDGANMENINDIESDVDDLETEIGNIKDGTTIVKKAEQDANGNNIANTYETKNDATNKLATKVDKTTKVIGLDLQDDILLTEFKTALGNATQSVAGLLSAEDKTHLDSLVALLESSDGNTVVDTIGEILAIFQNYPEGADLVTVLNGKVDKVAGKALSQNDFTDALKNKLDGLLNGSQYYDKNYIDALKDQNGWESKLLGTLSNNGTIGLSVINQYDEIQMYAKDTLGVIDNENIRPSLMQSGDSVYFFDDTQAFIMVDTVFGFYAPVGYTLQVVGLKYTELKAVDTTYDGTGTNYLGAKDNTQTAINELDTQVKAISERLLNLPIAELNNHTLREVFEGGNLVVNNDFNDTSGWNVFDSSNAVFENTLVNNGIGTNVPRTWTDIKEPIVNGENYYFNIKVQPLTSTPTNVRFSTSSGVVEKQVINEFIPIHPNVYIKSHNFQATSNADNVILLHFYDDNITKFFRIYHVYLINRTEHGISSLTVEQMDYWLSVYQALLVSDTDAIFALLKGLQDTLNNHKNDYTPHKLEDLESSRELLWGFEIDANGVLNFVLKEIE